MDTIRTGSSRSCLKTGSRTVKIQCLWFESSSLPGHVAELMAEMPRMAWNPGLMTGAMMQITAEDQNGARRPKISPGRVESLPGPREFPQNNGLGRNVQVFLESGSLSLIPVVVCCGH